MFQSRAMDLSLRILKCVLQIIKSLKHDNIPSICENRDTETLQLKLKLHIHLIKSPKRNNIY